MAFEKEINMLTQAEKERKPIAPISDTIPGGLSVEDANMICEGNLQRRLDAGEKLAGYKIGFTNIPVREKMGFSDSMYGYLFESMILKSGVTVSMDELIEPKIECEICFKLGQKLEGKDLTIEEVLAATEGLGASFEICDARIVGWQCPFPDIVADNGFAGRVVLSNHWHPVGDVDLPRETGVLYQSSDRLADGKGSLAMGHPAAAVSWLAGRLADRGKGLKSGQIVMTGTLTPIRLIERGASYTADFTTLGEVTATFI